MRKVCLPDVSLLITARKRSLGQGNIFTSVCQEFCSQGGSGHGGVPVSGGVWSWGGACSQGGLQTHAQGGN